MSLKLAARLVSPYFKKILDITEADTANHIADLSAIVPPGTIALIIMCDRVSGTGSLRALPNSQGTQHVVIGYADNLLAFTITIKNQELTYALTVNNDDWDIYLLGYFVQKRTR